MHNVMRSLQNSWRSTSLVFLGCVTSLLIKPLLTPKKQLRLRMQKGAPHRQTGFARWEEKETCRYMVSFWSWPSKSLGLYCKYLGMLSLYGNAFVGGNLDLDPYRPLWILFVWIWSPKKIGSKTPMNALTWARLIRIHCHSVAQDLLA